MTRKSTIFLDGLKTSQTPYSDDAIEIRTRWWPEWSRSYVRPTQDELFSLKQKEKTVAYKYSSPMESQRGTGKLNDPVYYEANDHAEKDGRETQRWIYYNHPIITRLSGWILMDRNQWLMAIQPEENEFGKVSP